MNGISPPDPRTHAYRSDLADVRLAGRVAAERYVEPEPLAVARGVVDLHRRPDPRSMIVSQLLRGEILQVFERRDAWAWVQNTSDAYVGYLREDALGAIPPPPTHRVQALRTPLFPDPDIKAPPVDFLSLAGPVSAVGENGRFVELSGGGYLFAGHLLASDATEADPVATALRLVGTPYLWGGRSSLGLDCSALVQLAFALAGRPVPRDSDQQEACAELGRTLPPERTPQRGDLLFWPGHVAIALDAETVVNATAHPLAVVVEPLAALDARARSDGGPLRRLRRP